MKKIEKTKLREQSLEVLKKYVQDKQKELWKTQTELKMGKHPNVRIVKNLKREIAIVKTFVNQKGNEPQAKSRA